MIVLVGRAVRERRPSAVEWRLIEYDADSLVPVAELGSQWEPAAMASVDGLHRISSWVTAWVEEVTGGPVELHPGREVFAPNTWHVQSPAGKPIPQDQRFDVTRSSSERHD